VKSQNEDPTFDKGQTGDDSHDKMAQKNMAMPYQIGTAIFIKPLRGTTKIIRQACWF
jgi:hypothetical protein|tara:strand:+ start:80527 stop:80697 length:171 start_codon:yes stop_codon:yes gene_type:complete